MVSWTDTKDTGNKRNRETVLMKIKKLCASQNTIHRVRKRWEQSRDTQAEPSGLPGSGMAPRDTVTGARHHSLSKPQKVPPRVGD